MASDFGANGPSTSPSNSAESFIGCFISLISKCEIRYEGVLYLLDVQDSTIGLKNGTLHARISISISFVNLEGQGLKSYGTEGRRKDGTQIPPSDKVYEYILFRGSDIKIKSPSTSSKSEEQILSDPAIIQSRYSGSPSSPVASVGGRNLTESIQRQDTPEISSKPFPVGLPSYQLVTELGPSNSSVATQVASHPSFSSAMSWQGPSDVSSSGSNSLLQSSSLYSPSMAASVVVQNQIKNEETQLPTKGGWTSFSERGLPMSSAMTSSLVNLTHLHSLTSLKNSDSLDIPSLSIPVPYSASMTFDGSNMPQFSSPYQDICPDPRPIHPRHSAPSFVDSTPGLLPTTPFLLTPDQFANPREQLLSTSHNLNPNQKGMGSLTQASLVPFPASQAPLLPLPTSVQKVRKFAHMLFMGVE
ncbi:hypothetical protein V8G54_017560 [Vigna mungo]|uniref:Lsm14-like N-terminal domain-containing protein n=1 Tax=Vigna mungo TaxID=3915 RepID=A0AAQ3NQ20_VIGMU